MKNKDRLLRKRTRVRSKIAKEGFRLSVFRSSRYIFAQIIDQKTGKTLLGLSDKKALGSDKKQTKTERAKMFGLEFAKEAGSKKIKKVVFDRGSFRFHGRVKAFAEGAREGGLEF